MQFCKKYWIVFFSTIVFILYSSCEYAPDEVNYHDIKVEPPNVQVTILNEETINILRGTVNISYESILNGHELYAIKVFIGDKEADSDVQANGTLTFDSRNFSDGEKKLRFELYVSTRSGSLADIAGAEYYLLTREYNVFISNTPRISD